MVLDKIRQKAEEQDKGLKQIAKEADVQYRSMLEWKKSVPSADKLYRVAKVLETTVEELLK